MRRTFNIGEYLRHVFLFASLEPESIEKIAGKATIKRYKKRAMIFNQGEAAEAFYIVVNGKVSVFRISAQGSEQVLHIHNDGDVVAEGAIFDKIKYPASCRALADTLMIKIPKIAFVSLIEENPKLSLKILSSYSKRLREFVTMVEYLSLDSVEQRLMKYFSRNKVEENGKIIVKMKISKKELAFLLGTIPETLSRNLKALKTQGTISEENKVITIKDLSKLDDFEI